MDGAVVNSKTQREYTRGRVYVQGILTELGLGELDDWMARVAIKSEDEFRAAVNPVFQRIRDKVNANVGWPSADEDGAISQSSLKVVGTALRRAYDAARHVTDGKCLEKGFFRSTFSCFKDAIAAVALRDSAAKADAGLEGRERRDRELDNREV